MEEGRTRGAKYWLIGWLAMSVILGIVAAGNPVVDASVNLGHWDTRQCLALVEMILLLVFAWFMHESDFRLRLHGFRDLHAHAGRTTRSGDETNRTLLSTAEGALGGLLSVQGIRATFTLIVLGWLLQNRAQILGRAQGRADAFTAFESLGSIPAWPTDTFFAIAVIGLSASVVTTLAAVQCYDYALRFDWGELKKDVRIGLVAKAHRLGIWGFYLLTWSLTVATALIEPVISFIAATGVFYVMWYYYFFKRSVNTVDVIEDAAATIKAGSTNVTLDASQAMLLGKTTGHPVPFKEVWPVTNQGLTQLKHLAPKPVQPRLDAVILLGTKVAE